MPGSFLDSNVILYAFDERNEAKQARAREILNVARQPEFCISFQVVQEVLNVITGVIAEVHAQDAGGPVLRDVLIPLWRVQPSQELYGRAIDVRRRYGYSFYDSLIIAAALEAGCTRVLSEDLQQGQRIEDLVIENPFRDLTPSTA